VNDALAFPDNPDPLPVPYYKYMESLESHNTFTGGRESRLSISVMLPAAMKKEACRLLLIFWPRK
jgi:hypothetical protein